MIQRNPQALGVSYEIFIPNFLSVFLIYFAAVQELCTNMKEILQIIILQVKEHSFTDRRS